MIQCVFGQDNYRIRQEIRFIIQNLKADISSYLSFDAHENQDLKPLINTLKNQSLFAGKQIIEIKNSFTLKGITRELEKTIKAFNLIEDKNNIIILSASDTNESLSKKYPDLLKILNKQAEIKNIKPLKGQSLRNWIRKECLDRGVSDIEDAAIVKLIGLKGESDWALIQEIEKLCSYANKKPITEDMVRQLVVSPLTINIFDLNDALAAQNRPKAYELLYSILASGIEPYLVLATIISLNRNLLSIKSLIEQKTPSTHIAKIAEIHPYVVTKLLRSSQNITLENMKKRHLNLQSIDTGTKNGTVHLVDALYNYILQ